MTSVLKNNIIISFLATIFIILGLNYSIFTIVAFGIVTVYIMFAKPDDTIIVVIYLCAYANIFKISPTQSSLYSYILLIFSIISIIKNRTINRDFTLCVILFAIYVIFLTKGNWVYASKQICIPLFIYVCISICNVKGDSVIYAYVAGIIISSVFHKGFSPFFPNVNDFVVNSRIWELSVDAKRFCGLYTDPNYYSCALIISLMSITILYAYKRISVGWFAVMAVSLIYFGSLTASKSFLLMSALVAFFFEYTLVANHKYYKAILLFNLFIVVVYLVFAGKIGLFSNSINRINKSIDLTTGRVGIWKLYVDYFTGNSLHIIFGSGFSNIFVNTSAAHNTYFDMLYYYGVLGTVLFIQCIVLGIKKIYVVKRVVINYIPLICYLIMICFLSYVLSYDFPICLVIVMTMLKIKLSNKQITER